MTSTTTVYVPVFDPNLVRVRLGRFGFEAAGVLRFLPAGEDDVNES